MEKPIAPEVAEATALVELARAQRPRPRGRTRRALQPGGRGAARRGSGRRLFIEGHRLGIFTTRSLDVDVVLDLMIHDLQIVSDLVRRPVREIRAVGNARR